MRGIVIFYGAERAINGCLPAVVLIEAAIQGCATSLSRYK